MIQEQAVVIGTDTSSEGRISVRIDRRSACESCQMQAGCGQKLVNDSSQRKCIEFELDNSLSAKVGDRVTLAIPEKSFLQASMIMYIVPLILMIGFAVLGEAYFAFGEGVLLLFSSSGFLLGLYLARRFAKIRQSNPDFHPHMVAVQPAQDRA